MTKFNEIPINTLSHTSNSTLALSIVTHHRIILQLSVKHYRSLPSEKNECLTIIFFLLDLSLYVSKITIKLYIKTSFAYFFYLIT